MAERGSAPAEYPAPPDKGPRIDVRPTRDGVQVTIDGATVDASVFSSPQQMHQLLAGLQHAWEQFTLGQV